MFNRISVLISLVLLTLVPGALTGQNTPSFPGGANAKYNFEFAPRTEAKPNGDWSKTVSEPYIHFVNWEGANWVGKLDGADFEFAPRTQAKPNGDWSKTVSEPFIHFVNWEGVKWVGKLNGANFEFAPRTQAKPNGDWSKTVSEPYIHFVNWEGAKWVGRVQP